MLQPSKLGAKKLAKHVYGLYGRSLPVDVEAIARHYGATVVRKPGPRNVSGMLVVKAGKPVIFVNANDADVRQRFTISHELGHLLMHVEPETETLFRDERSSQGRSRPEIQANSFAASLLMPEEEIRRLTEGKRIGPLDTEAIHDLAVTFGVSAEAMGIRLQDLGILRPDTYW